MKIYQLKPQYAEDDEYLEFAMAAIDPQDYRLVWEGDIGTDDPEKIFGRFYFNCPKDYYGRPLSPGDVLEINRNFNFISEESTGVKLWEIDGEKARFNRADFVGIADHQFLPDWRAKSWGNSPRPTNRKAQP